MTPTIDSEPSKDGGQMRSGTEETSTSTTGIIKTAGMAVLIGLQWKCIYNTKANQHAWSVSKQGDL